MPRTIQRDNIPELAAQLYGGDMNKAQAFIVQNGIKIVDPAGPPNPELTPTESPAPPASLQGAMNTVGPQMLPAVIQGVASAAGARLGGAPGLAAGSAIGSGIAQAMQGTAPEVFGEPSTLQSEFAPSLSFGQGDTSDPFLNILDDVTVDLATGGAIENVVRVARDIVRASKVGVKTTLARRAGRGFDRIFSTALPPETIAAYEAVGKKLSSDLMPLPSVSHSSGIVRGLTKAFGSESLNTHLRAIDDKFKLAFPRLAGTSEIVNGDTVVSESLIKSWNTNPLRKAASKIEPGEFDVRNKTAMQYAAEIHKRFRGMRMESSRLWNTLRRGLKDVDFELSPKMMNSLVQQSTEAVNIAALSPELKKELLPFINDMGALLKQGNGKIKFEELHRVQTALGGDINWNRIASNTTEKDRKQLYWTLKDEMAKQIELKGGPAATDTYNQAVKMTSMRFDTFNKDIRNAIVNDSSRFWDEMFQNVDSAKRFIKAAGGQGSRSILSARTEAVTRLMEKATNSNGDLNVSKMLTIWENSPGLRTVFSKDQKQLLSQYFTVLQTVDTKELSEVGNMALALRGTSFVIGLASGGAALATTGKLSTSTAIGSAATIGVVVGAHKFVKNVLLNDGEFARAALRLSKTPVGAKANPRDLEKIMLALHGSKVIIQDNNGNILDSNATINSKRNRQFRASGNIPLDPEDVESLIKRPIR